MNLKSCNPVPNFTSVSIIFDSPGNVDDCDMIWNPSSYDTSPPPPAPGVTCICIVSPGSLLADIILTNPNPSNALEDDTNPKSVIC